MPKPKSKSKAKSKARPRSKKRPAKLKTLARAAKRDLSAVGPRSWPAQKTIERQVGRRIETYNANFAAAASKRLNLVVHGDSWFDYPVGDNDYPDYPRSDIAIWLERLLIKPKPNVARIAHWGDAIDVLLGLKKRERLIKALKAGRPDAILFSGGGNNIVGENFYQFLNKADSVAHDPSLAVNRIAFRNVLNRIADGYRALIEIRDEHAPGVPILVHGYDFARPTNIGVCGNVVGPWLFPAFKAQGWMRKPSGDDLTLGLGIVRSMLIEFDHMLRTEIAANTSNVIVIASQGTTTIPGLWHNETHLKGEGFRAIARLFADEIAKI